MAKRSVEVQVFDTDFSVLLRESVTYEFKMETRPKNRLRSFVMLCLFLAVSGIIYFGYFCSDQVCALTPQKSSWSDWTFKFPIQDNLGKPLSLHSTPFNLKTSNPGLSYDDVFNENFQFDMNGHDVIVFLHIQKTGGTSFGKHLVQDLDLQRPCTCHRRRKRCNCFRPNRNEIWLFSRYSTGWKCGLHADWTELTSCVDSEFDKNEGDTVKRRYFYITLLREPISRYLSELRHVQRGATWRNSRHWCGGREATLSELPPCYNGKSWNGVTLDDFMSCEHNLAHNRQTRMMADLSLVGCYNNSYMPPLERNRVMLASAKRNLAAMAFFALTEYQKVGQYVFEETFNLRFAVPFVQHNITLSSSTMSTLRPDQIEKVKELNALDIELYEFARTLMFKRFEKLRSRDAQFKERFAHLGKLPGRTEFNWDQVIEDTTMYTENEPSNITIQMTLKYEGYQLITTIVRQRNFYQSSLQAINFELLYCVCGTSVPVPSRVVPGVIQFIYAPGFSTTPQKTKNTCIEVKFLKLNFLFVWHFGNKTQGLTLERIWPGGCV